MTTTQPCDHLQLDVFSPIPDRQILQYSPSKPNALIWSSVKILCSSWAFRSSSRFNRNHPGPTNMWRSYWLGSLLTIPESCISFPLILNSSAASSSAAYNELTLSYLG